MPKAMDPLPIQEDDTSPKENKEHQTPMVNEPYSIDASHTMEDILGFGPTRPPNEPIKDPLTNEQWARSIKDGYTDGPDPGP